MVLSLLACAVGSLNCSRKRIHFCIELLSAENMTLGRHSGVTGMTWENQLRLFLRNCFNQPVHVLLQSPVAVLWRAKKLENIRLGLGASYAMQTKGPADKCRALLMLI